MHVHDRLRGDRACKDRQGQDHEHQEVNVRAKRRTAGKSNKATVQVHAVAAGRQQQAPAAGARTRPPAHTAPAAGVHVTRAGALAPVALAEHELLGQGGARRRGGVGDHRHGLRDARGDAQQLARRSCAPPRAPRRAPRAPRRARAPGPRPSGSGAGPRPRSRSASPAPSRPPRTSASGTPARRLPATIGWPWGQVLASPMAAIMRSSSTGDIACSRRSASSWTSSQGTPRTSVRKRSIMRWRRTMSSACRAPESVKAIARSRRARDVAVALQAADHLVHRRRGELHRPREVGRRHRQLGLLQPEQALQVLLLGHRRRRPLWARSRRRC